MRFISRAAGIVLLVGSLPACSNDPEPPHNAKFYRDNPAERAEMLRRCAQDQNTENPVGCIAAQDAQLVAVSGK